MDTKNEKWQALKDVTRLRKTGRHHEAFQALLKIASRTDDGVLQARYAKILSSLDRETLPGQTPIRIAVLASTTDNFFKDILGFWLATLGFNAGFFAAAYDSIAQTILDPNSTLYQFDPDVVWIFTTFQDVKVARQFEKPRDLVRQDIDAILRQHASLWDTLSKRSRAYIIHNNADLPLFRPLGNYDGVAPWGQLNILRQYNAQLADRLPAGVTIFDLDYVSSCFGKERWFEPAQWYNSKIAFNLDAAGEVAYQASRLIAAIKGQAKKCLVLDLDNTLWGGVIGDDGLEGISLGDGPLGEAFVDFQRYVLELKRRGVILAVCSKNDEEKAMAPFLKHPDMVLRLEDISVFRANWGNKADNIRDIARILNISTDAMVFVDDNPAERELVSRFLPEVSVPALPEDPSCFRQALDQCRYFETVATSAEDGRRTETYRANASRDDFRSEFYDLADYLKGLEMEATVGTFDEFHSPRVVQLINKSNQFHLTTTRYGKNEVEEFAKSPDLICRHFSLRDKFGDYGLISVVILKKIRAAEYLIDTWCMSCRVLSRGMEEFICRYLIELGLEKGIKKYVGVYIPTAKNKLVSDLYPRLGFEPAGKDPGEGTRWQLDLHNLKQNFEIYIRSSQ